MCKRREEKEDEYSYQMNLLLYHACFLSSCYCRTFLTFAVEFIKEHGIMGKQQRTIPHGRYRLLDDKRSSKPDKLCAIYIEYSWNSAAIRRTTGYRCKVSDWNQKGNSGRGEFRSSYGSEFKRINNVMKVQLDKMDHDGKADTHLPRPIFLRTKSYSISVSFVTVE